MTSRPMVSFAFLLISSTGCVRSFNQSADTKEAWDEFNIPSHFGENYNVRFDSLPLQGGMSHEPWSDTYWPATKGGIAARWNPQLQPPFSWTPPTLEEAQRMSPEELARLSPVEKYELFLGDYEHKFFMWEQQRTRMSRESWEGICHGWASASIHFEEPKPVVLEGAHGIRIPFGASDVKALLSYYQAVIHRGRDIRKKALGRRCELDFAEMEFPGRELRVSVPPDAAAKCLDVNPGAFHIVLTNELGIRRQGFVFDVTADREVWNQPAFAYSSRIVKRERKVNPNGTAPGTTEIVQVSTRLDYGVEVDPRWENLTHIRGNAKRSVDYDYMVELNAQGEIIGGRWLDETRKPDYLALHPKPENFAGKTGYWARIGDIYAASLAITEVVTKPTQPHR